MELYESIVYQNIDFDKAAVSLKLTPRLGDLLKKLLTKDPHKRIGHNGAKEIIHHPWF